MAAAFFYLTLDERFAIHERIRDKFLAPEDIKLSLFFWTSPGDFILLIFLVAGLIMSPFFIKLFKKRKSSLICFITAIVFSALAVLIDSIEVKSMAMDIQRAEQFIEEILETTGMIFFLNSFFLMFMHHLEAIFRGGNNHKSKP